MKFMILGIRFPYYFVISRPAPRDEDEMMVAIFEAIDRMLNIVRPRKILYMAIDGVVSNFRFILRKSSKNCLKISPFIF